MRPYLVLFLLILTATIVGCTKTEDYLRQQFIDHSTLFDPASSMFRDVTYDGANIWCGEVNAKNRMGRYVGWVPFMMFFDAQAEVDIEIFDSNGKVSDSPQHVAEELRRSVARLGANLCKQTISTRRAPKWVPFWK